MPYRAVFIAVFGALQLGLLRTDLPGGSSSVFRRGGIFPTALCLSKAAIGAGVLSVAAHSAEVGALYQFACLLRLGMRKIDE